MGEPVAEQAPDVVIFFDANMPKMDGCNANCYHKELVFCIHRFIFRADAIYPKGNINGLDDFRVLQYFFKLIKENNGWHNAGKKPLFVLVTKDHDFLQDAKRAYKKVPKSKKSAAPTFHQDSVCDGKFEIIIKVINCKNYGTNRQDNFRCTIRELNKLWNSRSGSA